MKMEQIECSETSAYKIQTPGNHPEENIQHHYCLLAVTLKLVRLECFLTKTAECLAPTKWVCLSRQSGQIHAAM
jgi:hypothetical protein